MQLDEAQLNALPPADRAKYMAFESLFAHEGWKYVVALCKARADEFMRRGAFANSWAENRLAIGAGTAWDALSKLEEETETVYAKKVEEAERAELERQLSVDELEFE